MSNIKLQNPFHRPNPIAKNLLNRQSGESISNSNQNESYDKLKYSNRKSSHDYLSRNNIGGYNINNTYGLNSHFHSDKSFQPATFVPSAYYHIKKHKIERQSSSFHKYIQHRQLKPFNYDHRKQQIKDKYKKQLKNPFHRKHLMTDQGQIQNMWEVELSTVNYNVTYQNEFTKYDKYNGLKDESSKPNSLRRSLIQYLTDSNKYSNVSQNVNYQYQLSKPIYESIYNAASYADKSYPLQKVSSFSNVQAPKKQQSNKQIHVNTQKSISNQALSIKEIKGKQFHSHQGAPQVIKIKHKGGKTFYLNKLGVL